MLPSAAGVWFEVSTEGPRNLKRKEAGGHLSQCTSQTQAHRVFSASQGLGSNLLDGAPEGDRVPYSDSLSALARLVPLPHLADHRVGAGSRPHVPTEAPRPHRGTSLPQGALAGVPAAGAKACLPQADREINE